MTLFSELSMKLFAGKMFIPESYYGYSEKKQESCQSQINRSPRQILSDRFRHNDFSKFSARFIETIIITVTGFSIGYLCLPDAPFFTIPGFTWLMVGPFLSGIRYGFFYAVMSVLLVLGILGYGQLYQLSWATDSLHTIGLVLLWIAFVVGESRSYWGRRINQLNASNQSLKQQLSEISIAYSLTKNSHDRLQELSVSKVSLRDGVLELRKQIEDTNKLNENLDEVGSIILKVLSDQADIESASLHEVGEDLRMKSDPIDSFGSSVPIDLNNPLLIEALRTKKTVSLKNRLVADNLYTDSVLLAIPLVDVTGKVWGIVAVSKMPFRSYSSDNIRSISILAGYIGDLLAKKDRAAFSLVEDANLQDFFLQIDRCIKDRSSFDIPAVVFGFEIKYRHKSDSINQLTKIESEQIRNILTVHTLGLEKFWTGINRQGNPVFLLLLPLTTSVSAASYIKGLETLFDERSTFQISRDLSPKKVLTATDRAADVMDVMASRLNIDLASNERIEERKIYAIK